MIIKPRIRGFICTTAHPAGCAANVGQQIGYIKSAKRIPGGPRTVLVIGASSGYGLASRITAAFGCGASTVGVFLEREPSEKRPATAGWYNSAAFANSADAEGLFAANINGDAFSDQVKSQTIELLKEKTGPVDLVVYSVAAPVRTHPRTGELARSVLKPIGDVYTGKTLDTDKGIVKDIRLEPAGEKEIRDTVSAMGGEDWTMWIETLAGAGLLSGGCKTVAFSYIGPKLTAPIYWNGTIGEAKKDLDNAAKKIGNLLDQYYGSAYVSVMKALVTQASSAIPVVPLYVSLLYRVMGEKGLHEGCVEQIQRLFASQLYGTGHMRRDELGRIRMDDLEMREDVQDAVNRLWPRITTGNLNDLTDFKGYKTEFLKLFGFGLPGINYEADVDPAA